MSVGLRRIHGQHVGLLEWAGSTAGVLLEREPALEAVRATVDATYAGRSSVLFVLGEAGLGKTSILARARSAASGLSVGWAEGVAAETALPFGLLGQALGPLGALDELDAPIGLDSSQARVGFYHRCARALAAACATEPRLLLIDDLHWADSDSLGLLAYLLRRLRDNAVGVIATMRPWPSEATSLAEDLEAAGRGTIERLAPLADDSATQLALGAAGGELSSEQVEQLVGSCKGNPLLLVQAGATARGGTAWVQPMTNPAQQLVARFAGLAPPVIAVAKAASVAGIRFSPALAGAIAEADDRTVSSALSTLIRAGLARSQPDGQIEFVHPLFTQALYDSIEAPERSRLHAIALRALLALGADPARAASHAMAGHLVGDAVAVSTLETAGRAALAAGALDSAVRYLSAAAGLAGQLASTEILLRLAEAYVATGQAEGVKATCQRLLDTPSGPVDRTDTLLLLAKRAWGVDDMDEMGRWYTEAVEAAEGTDRFVHVLAQAVMVMSKVRGPRAVAAWSKRLRELSAGLSGDRRTEVDLAWGTVAALAGEADGSEIIRSALGPANLVEVKTSAPPTVFPMMVAAAFDSRLFVEQFDEADELFAIAWKIAEGQGALMTLAQLAAIQAGGHWWRGRLAASHELLDFVNQVETEAAKEQTGITLGMLAVEEGDFATAMGECAKFEELRLAEFPWYRTQLWRIQAELALDDGRIAVAVDLARRMRDLDDHLGVREPCWAPWADVAMIAFLRAGLIEDARALVDYLDMVTKTVPCRWPRSVCESGRAGLAEAIGDQQGAEEHHRQAVDLLEGIDLPLRRARALLSYGRYLRRTGRSALARDPLARAMQESEACGGMRFAAQARAELQAAGGRRRRVSATELSAQERNVVRMAVQGSRNEEIAASLFISVKTVEHHLTSAYLKLGVHSRNELRAKWATFQQHTSKWRSNSSA